MAYSKPGVFITQEQVTVSPVVLNIDMLPVIVASADQTNAKLTDYQWYEFTNISDVETVFGIGKANPKDDVLAYTIANYLALGVPSVGLIQHPVTTPDATKITEILEAKNDAYAVVAMTLDSDVLTALNAHVASMSLPEKKRERILFMTDSGSDWTAATTGLVSKRNVMVGPEKCWVQTTLLKSDIDSLVATQNLRIVQDMLYSDSGKQFTAKAGTLLTSALWAKISDGMADNVAVPVHFELSSTFAAAMVALLVLTTPPEQPITNSFVPFISGVIWGDTISEDTLDTYAEAGVLLLVSDKFGTGAYVRHQLTTDVSTIETRELSITVAVDYVAKLLRKATKPYVGRYNIDGKFLQTLSLVLSSAIHTLLEKGVVRDLKVLSMTQNQVTPDTIDIQIDLLPKYPGNYIKISLQI